MTDINKLCDELEALQAKATLREVRRIGVGEYAGVDAAGKEIEDPSSSDDPNLRYMFAVFNAAQPLIDAARESVRLRERIKELEQELKERTK